MTEIEDQRAVTELVEDIVDTIHQSSATGHHAHRIEVTLNRTVFLQLYSEIQWHRPVETDRIRLRPLTIALQQEAGALCKGDDPGIRPSCFYGGDHPRDRLHRECLEFPLTENTGPGIENLHSVGPGIDLRDEIVG